MCYYNDIKMILGPVWNSTAWTLRWSHKASEGKTYHQSKTSQCDLYNGVFFRLNDRVEEFFSQVKFKTLEHHNCSSFSQASTPAPFNLSSLRYHSTKSRKPPSSAVTAKVARLKGRAYSIYSINGSDWSSIYWSSLFWNRIQKMEWRRKEEEEVEEKETDVASFRGGPWSVLPSGRTSGRDQTHLSSRSFKWTLPTKTLGNKMCLNETNHFFSW